jgi:hypothetical protein
MTRWLTGVVVLFLVAFAGTALLTGEPGYIVPVLVLALLLAGYALLNRALMQRKVHRDGSLEEAMSDNTDPVPSAHLVPDDETALGDTPEAHDEVSPHDLPKDHPGRAAAERQAAVNVARGGDYTTHGDTDPSEVDRSQAGVARDATTGAGERQAETASRESGSTRGPRSGA